MTVREAVEKKIEFKEADLITIICSDYRKCRERSIKAFTRQYKGTDVWHEEVKDYCYEEKNGQLILSIAL